MKMFVLAVVALSLTGCLKNQEAPVAQEDIIFVWYPSGECKPVPNDGSPGSSPENPIKVSTAEDVYYEVFEGTDRYSREWKPNGFECRWISVSGFLDWSDYYHYRGKLLSGIPETRRYGDPFLWIENFQDANIRRSALVRRWVRVTGLYYDLCQSARVAQEASGEEWSMLFGPCHYGNDNGMMLKSVIVEEVEPGGPSYLQGETNRHHIGDIFPLEGSDRPAIEAATRRWFREVQIGPAAFAELRASAMSRGAFASQGDIDYVRRFHVSPDSYVSYLYGLEAVRALDALRAEVGVFVERDFETRERDVYLRAVGCVCLTGDCSETWPLLTEYAENYLGGAACTSLRYNPDADRWEAD
ncbi:MAG TPA: hypothetical protein PLA85_10110 [Micropepsaceae bacterium]|nr:hypothetical protein [Micropepsaceae bacterium]